MITPDIDVVVIGAGIQGAGAAQAAAAAGYSVVLLEQTGIASGTTSRSSKLIHGGLRYLESGQLKLVRECLRERTLLLRNALDLVRLTPHYIPVYRYTRRRPLMLRLGLIVYALLGGLRPSCISVLYRVVIWQCLTVCVSLVCKRCFAISMHRPTTRRLPAPWCVRRKTLAEGCRA